ncbi:hypothetical protein [Silvibacterium dinghuense]|uniref:Uncharacterized protein n=1 Tax=Silvibacterium dinghuense TaxID=1560006 RepID=A0A4Q1SCN8_9BACT|nr:hypothetical protein [Silvibacterium dinghuense]RXS94989.1 hypothetical protein ESZ00_10175 [Silvibacterium dinghuense]GGH09648.1 hypothetical protein GCM10011586_27700 [Silvibacterium dinghuense]
MAKLTITFGVVLIALGIFSFLITGHHYPTSLIPAGFGLLLAIFGALANSDDAKKRMLHMHIAVTIGLLGFLGTAKSIVDYIEMMQGRQFLFPAAVEEKAAMAVLLLIFVLLCVRSFINARRARA